jgi:threonine/homoserine/homoserine lactone efflux protein
VLTAYLLLTLVLVVTPGATTAVVIRNTLAGGVRSGLAAAAGAAVGNSSHAAMAGIGVAVLVARSPGLLGALQGAGALYLAWLGGTSLWRAARYVDGGLRLVDAFRGAAHGRSFREGVTVNLLNPAIISFYLAVVPAFVPATAPRGWFAVLAAWHVGLALTCHSVWALAFGRLRRAFAQPGARRAFQAGAGLALLGLAGRVIWPS